MLTATSQRGASRAAAREAVDPGVRLRLVADHDDRLLAGDRAQQRGRGAGMGAVVAEHESGGVRDHGAGLDQQRVGVAQHLRQQRRARVDRGAQPAGVVGRVELVGEGGDRLLRVHAPAQRRVEQAEGERPADVVADRLAVAVDEVGRAAALVVVAHERDRPGVGAKRRAGQREPVRRAVERGAQRGAPGRRLARVVDLVEHDERRPREVVGEQVGRRRDLLIGDDDAVDVGAPGAVGVAPARVEVQSDAVRGVRPLRAQRGRRADDDDLLAPAARIAWHAASVLPAPGRRDEQEVRPRVRGVAREELGLPGARRDHAGRAPFSRLQRGHSACPFAGLGRAARAHRLDVIGVPARAAAARRTRRSGRARRGTGRPERRDGSDARPFDRSVALRAEQRGGHDGGRIEGKLVGCELVESHSDSPEMHQTTLTHQTVLM